jgi:four helix bundle protein
MQDYEKLAVWNLAHRIAVNVQRTTAQIPRRDNSGLIGQLRRAALSVPANIAEGSCKESSREFARFLQIAAGSAAELHYHVRFAMDTALIPRPAAETLLAEITRLRKMLFVLLRRVREAISTGTTAAPRHQPSAHTPRPEALDQEPSANDD